MDKPIINKDTLRAHVFISGQVQGVNFRFYTQREAQKLDLTGFVRNLSNGQVEAIFEGDSEAIHKILAWCYTGPSSASVEKVDADYEEATGEFQGFRITW